MIWNFSYTQTDRIGQFYNDIVVVAGTEDEAFEAARLHLSRIVVNPHNYPFQFNSNGVVRVGDVEIRFTSLKQVNSINAINSSGEKIKINLSEEKIKMNSNSERIKINLSEER